MDAYRLNPDSNAIDELMLEDFMTPPYCLAIEWPSNLGELPWPTTLPLEFTISRDEKHRIQSIAK
jgi:tRNA threonylcarbamoyladenosine biosynthesis protein TsaE